MSGTLDPEKDATPSTQQKINPPIKRTGGTGDPLALQKSTGMTEAAFYTLLTHGLPPETEVRLRFGQNDNLLDVGLVADCKFSFFRYLSISQKSAEHSSAHVYPGYQQKGIGKQVNANFLKLYDHLGIDTIYTHPTEIGLYAWPKMGFLPNHHDWNHIRQDMAKRLDFLEAHPSKTDGPLPANYVDLLRKALDSPEPKTIWFIVDQDYMYHKTEMGKVLTLPLSTQQALFDRNHVSLAGLPDTAEWLGTLSLRDPECRARVEDHLQSAPVNATTTHKHLPKGTAP